MLNKINFFRRYRKKRFFQDLIKKDQVCFDIGANMGSNTDLFLSTGANVIAFEPQQQCFDVLISKFKNNPRVTVEKVAVGEINSQKTLKISNESQISTFSDEFIKAYSHQTQFNWNGMEDVEMKTLDTLIQKYGVPDFCKIDVEGYEPQIFTSLSYNIPLTSFEFNYPLRHLSIECIKILEKFESPSFNYVAFESPKFELNRWVNSKEMMQIINRLPEQVKTGDIYMKNAIL